MKVMKFGGITLTSGEDIKSIARIIIEDSREEKVAVVLSAMKNVTDFLIDAAGNAENGDSGHKAQMEEIKKTHLEAINVLFPPESQAGIIPKIASMLNELEEILHGIELVKECSLKSLDLIMSFGERLSCTLLAGYLVHAGLKAEMVDARDMITTNRQFGGARVLFEPTYKKIPARLSKVDGIPVITGFIGATEDGITSTLGRHGSDYSASLIGAGIRAESVEIWKNAAGVMSCDPKIVKNAFVISELSYKEAMELSHFGAEVLHPYTMIPAMDRSIRIRIKNVANPQAPGSVIAAIDKRRSTQITGISCIDSAAILTIEGCALLGSPGMAAHILALLARNAVSVIMLSQAASENSLCLVMKEPDADKAAEILNRELSFDILNKSIETLDLIKDLVIIAIVGENMRGVPDMSGNLFGVLGREGINVLAIAQGSSERNVSCVALKKDKENAIIALHKAFLED